MTDEHEVAGERAREDAAAGRALAERLHDPTRVLALSDGVFAIIITLLVLEVQVPGARRGQSLNQALGEIRPSLTAFVISFILAAMYRVGHRDLFALIRRTDRGLVLVVIAVMRVVIWLYATNRRHLLWRRLDNRQRRAGLVVGVLPGLVNLLAFLVARSAPEVSLLIYAGLPVLYFLSITVLRSGRKRGWEYADFT